MGRSIRLPIRETGQTDLPVNQAPQIAMRGFFSAIALAGLLITASGCTSGLTLAGLDGKNKLSQSFANCYATTSSNGDWDVVMVSDPAAVTTAPSSAPLKSAHVEPRQIVHLRVLWKPPAGTPGDQVAASNASVEWFLVGDDESRQDLIEYAGTAYVSLDRSGAQSNVVVRTANLRPVVCRGRMHDILGPSNLTGSVVATEDGQQVRQVLDEEKRLLRPADKSPEPGGHPISAAIGTGANAVP
jgi:hypothetical protein